jgi:hypothetical protein
MSCFFMKYEGFLLIILNRIIKKSLKCKYKLKSYAKSRSHDSITGFKLAFALYITKVNSLKRSLQRSTEGFHS